MGLARGYTANKPGLQISEDVFKYNCHKADIGFDGP